MTDPRQTKGREQNAALPGGRPDASTSDEAVKRTGRHEQTTAGPDGPPPRKSATPSSLDAGS